MKQTLFAQGEGRQRVSERAQGRQGMGLDSKVARKEQIIVRALERERESRARREETKCTLQNALHGRRETNEKEREVEAIPRRGRRQIVREEREVNCERELGSNAPSSGPPA